MEKYQTVKRLSRVNNPSFGHSDLVVESNEYLKLYELHFLKSLNRWITKHRTVQH